MGGLRGRLACQECVEGLGDAVWFLGCLVAQYGKTFFYSKVMELLIWENHFFIVRSWNYKPTNNGRKRNGNNSKWSAPSGSCHRL